MTTHPKRRQTTEQSSLTYLSALRGDMRYHGLRCASCRANVIAVFEQHGGGKYGYQRAAAYLKNQRPH